MLSLNKFMFVLLLLMINLNFSNSSINILQQEQNNISKFYILAKYVTIKDVPDHPLNLFNYKNAIFTSNQIIIALSADPSSPVSHFLMLRYQMKLGTHQITY